MSQESVEGGREGFPGPRFKGLTYTVGSGALYSFQLKNQSWVGWGRNSSLKNCPFPGCGDWKHLIRWWQFSCQVMSDSCNPIDCSPSSSVCGILQARILEWIAISFSRELPDPGIEPSSLMSPALAGGFKEIRRIGNYVDQKVSVCRGTRIWGSDWLLNGWGIFGGLWKCSILWTYW